MSFTLGPGLSTIHCWSKSKPTTDKKINEYI
jgi:hypothetical protein